MPSGPAFGTNAVRFTPRHGHPRPEARGQVNVGRIRTLLLRCRTCELAREPGVGHRPEPVMSRTRSPSRRAEILAGCNCSYRRAGNSVSGMVFASHASSRVAPARHGAYRSLPRHLHWRDRGPPVTQHDPPHALLEICKRRRVSLTKRLPPMFNLSCRLDDAETSAHKPIARTIIAYRSA